jgi:hypothetical protein
METHSSHGEACPPRGPARDPAVLSIPPGEPVHVILASPCLWGVFLHWGGRRSVFCPGQGGGCELCKSAKIRYWYGYAMAALRETRQVRIVEVSAAAYHHCPTLRECEGKLTGMVAELSRMGESKNSGLKIRLHDGTRLGLPPGIPSIRSALSRLLGVNLT